jgi:hypothetical protein
MIEITSLKESDKGRAVTYRSTVVIGKLEYGTITSWNDHYIFVDYYQAGGRVTATSPQNLDWAKVEIKKSRDGKVIITPIEEEQKQ